MAEFKPIVYTAGIPQGLQLPSMCNQHLLSGFAFVVPPEMAQVGYVHAAASAYLPVIVVQLHLDMHEVVSCFFMMPFTCLPSTHLSAFWLL